jgi:protein-cysteine N-palmitoyltransferase HHAT
MVRDNLPYLILLLILHPLCRKAYDSFWRTATYTNVRKNTGGRSDGLSQGLPANAAASVRQEQRLSFDFYFALILIAALHGFSALKVFLILYINYKLAKSVPPQYLTAVTWTFNIAILFANEYGRGYSYASVALFLSPSIGAEKSSSTWGHWLDSHGGLISRWEVLFNLTVLRLISFNLDYKWSIKQRGGNAIEVCARLELGTVYARC